ncbi:MAG: zinc-ribbon domain containing protein [Deltaproteobacteria bacterium]|nr:zinc-ribbon domain containing protein [Deltaproteobacteria bacterium]
MAFEDKTLHCVECNESFIFSANEQDFYAQKKLTSEPKRCKACRQKAKKRKRVQSPYAGEYRSPAFNDSQFRRPKKGRNLGQRPNRRPEYRSPAFRDQQPDFSAEYRSPAFREYEGMDNAEEYRSPAFREYDHIKPEEEYRSPAFREYDHIKPEEEYRSPAFSDSGKRKVDQRPMFSIVCVACGEQAMVPFLPEEKDDPMCRDCYREHRELLKKEQEEETRKATAAAAEEAAASKEEDVPTPTEDQIAPPAAETDTETTVNNE